MNLDQLVVGSIKDRVVCAAMSIGEAATRSGLRKAVSAQSSVLEIAIDALHRDGYLYLSERGHYVVEEEYAATLQFSKHSSIAKAESTISVPQQSAGAAMAKTKICKKCETPKDSEKDFYKGSARCKRCVLDGQAAAKSAKANGAAPARAKKAAPATAKRAIATITKPADEVIIPAAGEIRCRVFDAGAGAAYSLHQGDDQITLSLEQLQALHSWAGAVLKVNAP